jgi:hypothetical protein
MSHEQRRKVRVNGGESLADVARVVLHDVRLAVLLGDLNPTLPSHGPLAPAALVLVPSRSEAAAFAKKMGFTLGFDEAADNGTAQKRAWARLQGPGPASHVGIDAADAARQLLARPLSASDVGKRLVKLCTPEALAAFVAGPVEPALAAVVRVVDAHLAWPRAHARVGQAVAVLEATTRPGGLLALLEAFVADAAATDRLLAAVLVPPAVRQALSARAAPVVTLVQRARALARVERGARDVTLKSDPDGAVLAVLVAAVRDDVAPVFGERLGALGLLDASTALTAHLTRLVELLKSSDEQLPRASVDVMKTLASGQDGARLPKPWPLVAAVVRGLAPVVDAAGVAAVDGGLGGLLAHPRPSSSSSLSSPYSCAGERTPVVLAATLQQRAAHGARTVDEGAALADRLASGVITLLSLAAPLSGDAGPAPLRRARRKAHFDSVTLARSAPRGEAIAALVDELFADARRTGLPGVDRVTKAQQQAARELGRTLTSTIALHQKNTSELARAVVIVALTIDRDQGSLLLRPTGREAFRAVVEKHAGRLLSRASLAWLEAVPCSSSSALVGSSAAA